jgi:hypothetical protein
MRVVAWILVAAVFLPFVPSVAANHPLAPVVLTGMLDGQGYMALQWTGPVTVDGGPSTFVVTRTFLDESEPASDFVELPGSVASWTDRNPPASTVVYSVSYKMGGQDSVSSNPVVRGPWPHCAVLLLLVLPPPPWYDLQPECLFPLPELPPDAP